MREQRRYEIGILIGPCYQHEAELAMQAAHETADNIVPGAGTALTFWNEDENEPGEPVMDVKVL